MEEIKGFEGLYSAHKLGKIWSHRQNKFLKTWLIGNGYEMVTLYKNGQKPMKFLVHRLVALTYIPNPNSFREVNHKNAKRLDNQVKNLEWVSSKENKRHAIRLGLYKNLGKNPSRGMDHHGAKLTDKKVRRIRLLGKKGVGAIEIAKRFGVTRHLIYLICVNKIWTHIV